MMRFEYKNAQEAVAAGSDSEYLTVESAFGYRGEDPLMGFNAVSMKVTILWPEVPPFWVYLGLILD